MPRIPHPIPYQGSKRKLAGEILSYLPGGRRLIEPFCGSAAVSLAAITSGKVESVWLNDSLLPLTGLWYAITHYPESLSNAYEDLWVKQQSIDAQWGYQMIRAEYNRNKDPSKLLFLLARCVKNSPRFNQQGEFNQSSDRRRLGTNPERMRKEVWAAADLLRGKSQVTCEDYSVCLAAAGEGDLVYLDPPYQGTSGKRDTRYAETLDFDRLVVELEKLQSRGIPFVVSLDGRCGEKRYGRELPSHLDLIRVEVQVGRSAQATLNGRSEQTVESLYMPRKR